MRLRRSAANLLTGPLAFLVAGLIDVALVLAAPLRRLHTRRGA